MKHFYQVLVNTLIANVTTSFLWFALVFWIYLETKSVLATGIIGGAYMLLVAIFSMVFGTVVDRHKKKSVFLFSSVVTLLSFAVAGMLYLTLPTESLLDITSPLFWLFIGVILVGAVVENMRNIALSTTVTLLVPKDRRANANGLVGTVSGIGFIITSVFSGLAIGLLGMGWTLAIAITLTALGANSLVVKDAAQLRRNEFLQVALNSPVAQEVVGKEGVAALLREQSKTLDMDTDEIVPPLEVLRLRWAQQQQAAASQQAAPQFGSGQTLMNGAPTTDNFSPMAIQ